VKYNIGGHNEKQNLDVVHTICDLLDEIVPKEGLIAIRLRMLLTVPVMTAAMRLMRIKLALNWAGSLRRRSKAGFVRRWNGI
jgi:dTDP-D-glucose 4,6-dehydratase